MLVLITGATGKVGRHLIEALLGDPGRPGVHIRALCHNRDLPLSDRLSTVRGSIASRDVVREAMDGVTHVVHLATCKETPDDVMDVTVKGLFWLLEEMRLSPTARRFILIGGDAAVGHFHVDHGVPITEATPHHAYPGCYALSKVLEEAMLECPGRIGARSSPAVSRPSTDLASRRAAGLWRPDDYYAGSLLAL